MKSEWKTVLLGDVCNITSSKRIFAKEYQSSGIPFYRGKEIIEKHKGHKVSTELFISQERFDEIKAKYETPQIGDVLLSSVGTLGIPWYVDETDFYFKDGNLTWLRADARYLDSRYLYIWLNSNAAKEQIDKMCIGSTQKALTIDTLNKFVILLPPLGIQHRIAAILWDIKSKIAHNTAINENLEQQAQALFKAWFVDFEPFGGVMPDDWRMGTFSEIIESTFGGDWGKEAPTGNYTERVFCIRGADIPEVKAGNKGKMPTRYILPKNFSNKKLVADDIVVEISGGSPTQSTGRVAAISQSLLDRYDSGMICTNFCRAIKPCEGYSNLLYYYWQYLYDRKVFFSYENGTTGIKNLDLSGFIETEPIIIPSVQALDEFNCIISAFYSQIFENGQENEQLATIRDTLLPKLMNGEIDVSAVRI